MKQIFGVFLSLMLFAGSVAPAFAQGNRSHGQKRRDDSSLYFRYKGRVDTDQRRGPYNGNRRRNRNSLYFGYQGRVDNNNYQRRRSNYRYQPRGAGYAYYGSYGNYGSQPRRYNNNYNYQRRSYSNPRRYSNRSYYNYVQPGSYWQQCWPN